MEQLEIITWLIFFEGEKCRVFVTGGASKNQSILQILSDIFNADVFTQVWFFFKWSFLPKY